MSAKFQILRVVAAQQQTTKYDTRIQVIKEPLVLKSKRKKHC